MFAQKLTTFSARSPNKKMPKGGPRGGMCPPLPLGFEGGAAPLKSQKNFEAKKLGKQPKMTPKMHTSKFCTALADNYLV